MKQTITLEELKAGAGDVVNAVRLRGDRYIISRYGKPAAAIVPLEVLDDYELRLARLGSAMKELRKESRNSDPRAIESAVSEAVDEYRAERRSRGRKNRKGTRG